MREGSPNTILQYERRSLAAAIRKTERGNSVTYSYRLWPWQHHGAIAFFVTCIVIDSLFMVKAIIGLPGGHDSAGAAVLLSLVGLPLAAVIAVRIPRFHWKLRADERGVSTTGRVNSRRIDVRCKREEIAALEVIAHKEGSPVYQYELRLRTRDNLTKTLLRGRDQEVIVEIAASMRTYLRLPESDGNATDATQ
jgi:hypothetical protein